ncbi:MAG: hypothetical protein ACI4WX_01480 [Aristaeellaceae bacterium]
MSISNCVKMALAKAGKKQRDLADLYGCTKQSMSTKFRRESWFGKDLAKVAEFTGGKLAFVYPDGQTIYIETEIEEAPDADTSEAGE